MVIQKPRGDFGLLFNAVRLCLVLFVLLLTFGGSLLSLGLASSTSSSDAPAADRGIERVPLTSDALAVARGLEQITLTPDDLPEFRDYPISDLRVFTSNGGHALVPFQVDEKDSFGRFAFGGSSGLEASAPGKSSNVETSASGDSSDVETSASGKSSNVETSASGDSSDVETSASGDSSNVETSASGGTRRQTSASAGSAASSGSSMNGQSDGLSGPPLRPERGEGRERGANGLFDGHDELVFFAASLTPKGSPPPKDLCGGQKQVEVAVGRGEDSPPLGWIIIAQCQDNYPISKADYVRFDPLAHAVRTPDYEMRFAGENPMHPRYFRFFEGKFEPSPNLLHGIFVDGQARLLAGLFKINRGVRDFKSRLLTHKDGAIRVVRRVSLQVRTLGDRYTHPSTFTLDTVLQRGLLTFDLLMNTDTDLSSFLHDLLMSVAWDFSNFDGMTIRYPGISEVGLVDGEVTKGEMGFAGLDADWIFASGPQGVFIGTLEYSTRLPIQKNLLYRDEGGGRFKLGYRLSQLHKVTSGRSEYRVKVINFAGGTFEQAMVLMKERQRTLRRVLRG